jgi:hypothetical protein
MGEVKKVKDYRLLKWRQKLCLNLLIKKKRVAQLIYEKPGKNQYKRSTSSNPQNQKISNSPRQPDKLSQTYTNYTIDTCSKHVAFDESTSTTGNGQHQSCRMTQTERTS